MGAGLSAQYGTLSNLGLMRFVAGEIQVSAVREVVQPELGREPCLTSDGCQLLQERSPTSVSSAGSRSARAPISSRTVASTRASNLSPAPTAAVPSSGKSTSAAILKPSMHCCWTPRETTLAIPTCFTADRQALLALVTSFLLTGNVFRWMLPCSPLETNDQKHGKD